MHGDFAEKYLVNYWDYLSSRVVVLFRRIFYTECMYNISGISRLSFVGRCVTIMAWNISHTPLSSLIGLVYPFLL